MNQIKFMAQFPAIDVSAAFAPLVENAHINK